MTHKPVLCPTCGCGFVRSYVHYRTGKVMDAQKYGYRAWPFGCRCRRKK
ncbi:MAG TPA: hypothetical protein VFZ09_36140 [Archangium sp.]|nr:hypothetical protein [Archangium sp.]HEX5751707.1 hypothetical protein [Archangium sp.]